ncbi:hypothetical protein P3X46_004741 [Hevea brasiliensis]|uniref:Arabidopsis retrotransposon Orf1 C-terminal domain-containing protein n=1 Tax=Hevea brasiliensis TaxID=3981 RepID=A0ABQ9MZ26_HEVBR|nr:hypothetical protein P3X46_004741 [Hevea brasiliensis]
MCTRLHARKISSTKYMDFPLLEQIRLQEEINGLLDSIGWTRFAQLQFLAYKDTILEFLGSFKANLWPTDREDRGRIEFRLLSVDRIMNMDEFNAIFDFDSASHQEILRNRMLYNNINFWDSITPNTELYNSSKSKSTGITSPAQRYMHRFSTHTIMGRGDSLGIINASELFFVWCMVTRQLCSTGFFLCNHLRWLCQQSTEHIVLSGLVTTIALHFRFVPGHHRLRFVIGTSRIDQTICISMGICKKVGKTCYLVDAEGNTIPRRDEAREGPSETSQPQEERQGQMFEESPIRVPPHKPPLTDPVLAYLQRMETIIYSRMRAIEDSL